MLNDSQFLEGKPVAHTMACAAFGYRPLRISITFSSSVWSLRNEEVRVYFLVSFSVFGSFVCLFLLFSVVCLFVF